MRATWGTLVAVGAFVVLIGIAGSLMSDYIDKNGSPFRAPGGEVNVAGATVERMRYLIGHLRLH